jgi:hypothetical protein
MTPLAQNLAVLLIVGGCAGYVLWQVVKAFRGRNSKLGSCCARGCAPASPDPAAKPAPIHFIPLANIGIKPKHKPTRS